MKILFIGHYKEPSGWGEMGRLELECFNEEFDIVARSIDLIGSESNDLIRELESRPVEGITHCVQYVLPKYFRRVNNCKNIGYCEIESNSFEYSDLPERFLVMDRVLCANYEKSINSNIEFLPHPTRPNVNTKINYPKIDIPTTDGTYIFYMVAENVPRKNIESVIEAFHLTFDPTEPVSLVIKTNNSIEEQCGQVRNKLRLYKNMTDYKSEIALRKRLTDQEMLGLHQMCDCFINASSGEGWCLPMYDAALFGNEIITTEDPGHILKNYQSLEKVFEPCNQNAGIVNYQTGFDFWEKPSISSLCQTMRNAYKSRERSGLTEVTFDKRNSIFKEMLNESN